MLIIIASFFILFQFTPQFRRFYKFKRHETYISDDKSLHNYIFMKKWNNRWQKKKIYKRKTKKIWNSINSESDVEPKLIFAIYSYKTCWTVYIVKQKLRSLFQYFFWNAFLFLRSLLAVLRSSKLYTISFFIYFWRINLKGNNEISTSNPACWQFARKYVSFHYHVYY